MRDIQMLCVNMEIEHLLKYLDKLAVAYHANAGATDVDVKITQARLEVEFPYQVSLFFKEIDGLMVQEPKVEVFSLDSLEARDDKIVFAKFNGKHEIAFHTSSLNQAEQWDIVNANTGFLVTLTMASFWSNKLAAWLRSGREIWAQEKYT